LTLSFRPHYGPGIDSALNRNKCKEHFLGSKGGRCLGMTTLPPSCADYPEIWESQPPGTLRDYRGLYRDCFTCTFTSHCQLSNIVRYLPIQYARIPLQLKYRLSKLLRPKTTELPNNF